MFLRSFIHWLYVPELTVSTESPRIGWYGIPGVGPVAAPSVDLGAEDDRVRQSPRENSRIFPCRRCSYLT